jgi:rod shape-determining protein MreD
MKNFILYSIIFVTGLVTQFCWVKYISPAGLSPNFLLVCLVFISLIRGPLEGQLLGFAWGLSWDAMSTEMFGCHAFLFTCMGYLIGILSKKWDESKVSAQMSLVFIASLFFLLGMKMLYAVFGGGDFVFNYNYLTGIQLLLSVLIAPIIFWAGKIITNLLDD